MRRTYDRRLQIKSCNQCRLLQDITGAKDALQQWEELYFQKGVYSSVIVNDKKNKFERYTNSTFKKF